MLNRIRKNFSLDAETISQLKRLAERETEGNESLLLRKMVRERIAKTEPLSPTRKKDAPK